MCFAGRVHTADDPAPHAPSLVYGLEERVPPGPAVLVSLQHVAAMVVGTITPPLILAGILKWNPADTAYFVSMALLASALGTLLQTLRPGPVGSGLLSVTGTSFSFLQPLVLAGQAGGLALMFGMSLVTAPVQLVIAPFLPKLRRVFTPLVSGVVVLLIGLSLIPSAMHGIVAPAGPDAPVWAGGLVAMVVITVVLGAQAAGRPWARVGGVLFGVAAGYGVCGLGGWLAAPVAGDGSWITLPRWMPHGFAFDWSLVPPFAFIYLVSVLEAMGDMTATAQLSGLPAEGADHRARLRGGIFADGLTSLLSALAGGFPSTTYAQNNGVIQITGVASRRIGPLMALILALLGIFPAVGRWVTAMPPAVLGALALLLFGLVAVSGLRLIASRGVGQRDALVVALALAVGLGAPTQAGWLAELPGALRALLESGIAAGGVTALVLNLVLPGGAEAASGVGTKTVEEVVAAFPGPVDLVDAQVAHDGEDKRVERGLESEN
ncbi:uracil-xanthine permease [Opitutaceae bacterium TAV5]|nr:uracil-xanthine permease [Opitutaceae bacterium TAV5]